MKALFISNDPTIFDATSAARARMHAYAALMDELHIISAASRDAKEEQDGNLYLHPVHTWKLFRVRSLARRARTLILKYGIEVVSAQDPFEQGLAALRAIKCTNAKLHIQVHTDFLSPWFVKVGSWRMSLLNRYRRRIADRVLPRADGIRVVGERVKTSLLLRYGSRIPEPVVIPVAVDAEVPAPVLLPEHPFFTFALIAVGRLESEKRIEDILTALAIVGKRHPTAGLFIVGEGRERRRLEHVARTLGLTEKVIFLGNRPDARSLMASAHAFIQASAYEGYGRTLIEAALAKIPIITTNVGIIGDVFQNCEDVLVAPVADPDALALCISRLIEDNCVRFELSTCAETAAHAHLAAVGDLPTRIAENLAQITERNVAS